MKKGTGELKFVSGGRAAFAQVTVEFKITGSTPGHSLEVREPEDGRHLFFIDAARAGVRYGLARLGRKVPMALDATITDIQATLVDTNEMMVIYAAAEAVWNAWGHYPDIVPVVDKENRLITFHF